MKYIENYIDMKKLGYFSAVALSLGVLAALPASAAAVKASSTTGSATVSGSSDTSTAASAKAAAQAARVAAQAQAAATARAAAQAAVNQARLTRIINRGNTEINRRLVTLRTLGGIISSATKLTPADAATLNATVNSDISQLTTLQTQLDADTTVTAAITDAQSIINDYRVYLLVVPQVNLVKTADDQQVAEGKLATLSAKLAARITAAQQKGTNVTAMQTTLADLNSKVTAAEGISGGIESGVIGLVPSDYNTNHDVLSGDRSQLQTAQSDIGAAIKDAQTIISQLPAS